VDGVDTLGNINYLLCMTVSAYSCARRSSRRLHNRTTSLHRPVGSSWWLSCLCYARKPTRWSYWSHHRRQCRGATPSHFSVLSSNRNLECFGGSSPPVVKIQGTRTPSSDAVLGTFSQYLQRNLPLLSFGGTRSLAWGGGSCEPYALPWASPCAPFTIRHYPPLRHFFVVG